MYLEKTNLIQKQLEEIGRIKTLFNDNSKKNSYSLAINNILSSEIEMKKAGDDKISIINNNLSTDNNNLNKKSVNEICKNCKERYLIHNNHSNSIYNYCKEKTCKNWTNFLSLSKHDEEKESEFYKNNYFNGNGEIESHNKGDFNAIDHDICLGLKNFDYAILLQECSKLQEFGIKNNTIYPDDLRPAYENFYENILKSYNKFKDEIKKF